MEQSDLDLEQRVWQRMTGGTQDPLEILAVQAEEAASAYRYLAQNGPAKKRDRMQAVYRQAAASAAALRGMVILSGREALRQHSYGSSREHASRMLALAYRRSAQLFSRYEQLREHPEYGCVFDVLCERERGIMAVLLELVGEG